MKNYEEMTFEEFLDWSAKRIITGLGKSESIRESMWFIFYIFTSKWLPANGWKKYDKR